MGCRNKPGRQVRIWIVEPGRALREHGVVMGARISCEDRPLYICCQLGNSVAPNE